MLWGWCWLDTDKAAVSDVYMLPVVMSRTYGEREVALSLTNSWEIIGGRNSRSLTAYVDDTTAFEFNSTYTTMIEDYAEDIYRVISKKVTSLPSSSQSIKKSIMKDTVKLTPQESEQLSKYASDDAFVETQKRDIETLSSMYKELLNVEENGGENYYINILKDHFNTDNKQKVKYTLINSDEDICINIDVNEKTSIRQNNKKNSGVFIKYIVDKIKEEICSQANTHLNSQNDLSSRNQQ